MIFEIPFEIKRQIHNLLHKFDFDAFPIDFAHEFGYLLCSYEQEEADKKGISGLYQFDDKKIWIAENLFKDEYSLWSTFSHEFGHLFLDEIVHPNFNKRYLSYSSLFSEIVEDEQLASLIGLEIMNWRYPKRNKENKEKLTYFKKDDILFLKNYYEGKFEIDLNI